MTQCEGLSMICGNVIHDQGPFPGGSDAIARTMQFPPVSTIVPACPLRLDDVLGVKYRVGKVLGRGGMGIVLGARHLQLGHRVAVKLLIGMDPRDAMERLLREGQVGIRLQSEHATRVLDIGNLETGQPYLVMEYLDGHDLDRELAARGPLPVPEAVDYLLQASEAIAEAHALGIVHRDLKPANLFVTRGRDGRPLIKVLDFGLASVKGDTPPNADSGFLGTVGYMAPEQIRSPASADARSDIWSLGVILHELISGILVFDGDSVSDIMNRILQDSPPLALAEDNPEFSGILPVIRRCLEKDASARYQSLAELALALERLASVSAGGSVQRIVAVLGFTTGAFRDSGAS